MNFTVGISTGLSSPPGPHHRVPQTKYASAALPLSGAYSPALSIEMLDGSNATGTGWREPQFDEQQQAKMSSQGYAIGQSVNTP